jgi:DNA-binding MarR family transcriptional regulator
MSSESDHLVELILQRQGELHRASLCLQSVPSLDLDVTMAQLKALFSIGVECSAPESLGPLVSDLARVLGVTAGTASILIDRLVERGLVDRRQDPDDRRRHRCRLTPAGEQLLRQLYEVFQNQSRALFAVLSEDELRAVLHGVDTLITATERFKQAATRPVPLSV